tara:strand:- start:662 stop:1483 length:822 start_codon:yes stop_codon:yes gene_type:complete
LNIVDLISKTLTNKFELIDLMESEMPDWMVLPLCMVFGFMLLVSGKEVGIDHPIITALIAIGCFLFPLLMLFEPILNRKDTVKINLNEEELMSCYYCNVEHKVKNKEKHLKKCMAIEKEKLAKLEAKKKKENDPNLMTAKRKSQLEEIADRVFPNARYFKYKGEKMELTTDIGGFKYSSCNSRSIESIDKQMVADSSRGYNRRNKPKSKNKSSVAKSYSGVCSQQKRNHSTCGSPTDSRCPRCSRYACGSCRGSRTYNGRRVCEACNRNMSGD